MGPGRSSGWLGRGSLGPGPGKQKVAAGRAGGGEARGGAADRQSQRQTDGRRGEKMATRTTGARCSRSRSEWGACWNLTSLLPPPPRPLPAPEARAWRCGRGLGEKGPGRRDLESIQSPAFQRGPARVLVLATHSRASRGFRRSPQGFRAPLEPINSTQLSSPPWFPLPTSSSATKPTSPNHSSATGFPICVAEPEPPVP